MSGSWEHLYGYLSSASLLFLLAQNTFSYLLLPSHRLLENSAGMRFLDKKRSPQSRVNALVMTSPLSQGSLTLPRSIKVQESPFPER